MPGGPPGAAGQGPGTEGSDEVRNLLSASDVDGFDMHGDPDLPLDGDPDLQHDLAAFREELRAFADRPAPAMSQELARFVAGLGGIPETVPDASRRKRPMILQTLSAKVVAAGVATFAMFSGLAVAGALPDTVQSAVSSAGDAVGVGLPHPEDHQAEVLTSDASSPDESTTAATSATSLESSTSETTATSTETSAPTSIEGHGDDPAGAPRSETTVLEGSAAPTPTTSPNCRSFLPPGVTVVQGLPTPAATNPGIQALYDSFLQCEQTHQRPGEEPTADARGDETEHETEAGDDHGGETATTRTATTEHAGERSATTTTRTEGSGEHRSGSDAPKD